MNSATVLLLIYFVAMVIIGIATMRRGSADAEGYMLGGRSLGPAVTALRLQSSSMSGYMFLGAGSLGYTQGYFGMWYALGDLGGGILNLSVLGRRMRALSKRLGSLTSIEYLEHRYPSKWVRALAAPIALFCIFFYVLAQFIAGGRGLAMVTGIEYEWALLVAIGVILLYTFLGGYLAVAYTDFAQAIIMAIGMLWIVVATLISVGGLTSGNEQVGGINANLLTMWGAELQYENAWGLILGALLVFSIGYMGWPHVVVSHMAMRKPSVARLAGVYSLVFNLLFIPGAYLVGMLALVVVPALDDPEMAIFEVAYQVLPMFAVGIVMAAIMAAIMSTADALLLQAGTMASQDLFARFINRRMDSRQMVWVARVMVIILAVIGYGVAVTEPPAVFSIVVFATSVLGSAFVPAYVCAVWWRKANSVGAIASMIAGTVGCVSWQALGLGDTTGLDPMVIGLLASTTAMIVGSLTTQRLAPVPAEVLEAVDAASRVGGAPASLAVGAQPGLAGQLPRDGQA